MKLSIREKFGYSLGDTASHFVWDLVNFWLIFYYFRHYHGRSNGSYCRYLG